jgi:hypothetical protein
MYCQIFKGAARKWNIGDNCTVLGRDGLPQLATINNIKTIRNTAYAQVSLYHENPDEPDPFELPLHDLMPADGIPRMHLALLVTSSLIGCLLLCRRPTRYSRLPQTVYL